MAQAPDGNTRKRNKRSTLFDMVDALYPKDDTTEDEERDGQDSTDDMQDDTQGAGNARRSPMQDAADSLYPEKGQDDQAGQEEDESGQEGDKPAKQHGAANAQSQVVQAFLQTNPLQNLPHAAVSPAPTLAEQSEREAQAFASFLSKISKTECPLLEKDIGLEQGTISSLSQMVKEGKDFEHGLPPHADDHGYVNSEIVSKKSYTYQRLLKLLESDKWRAFTDKLWVGAGAALTLGLNKPLAMREKERSEWVLRGMIDTYDKLCKK